MILNQNYEISLSFTIYLIVKILCKFFEIHRVSMHNKHPTLTSIPERNESEDDMKVKWVPKKKHEVLKAKYKCLKKLFQIYDASVIGILPDTYAQNPYQPTEEKTYKRKRSRRTKTDACAGTTETCGDASETEESVATAIIKDLRLDQLSCTQIDRPKTTISKIKDDKSTQDSKEDLSIDTDKSCDYQHPHPIPYLIINDKKKPTRFQSFIQRILGIRREKNYAYAIPHDHPYAASDDNITNRYEKRRRRGLRVRRLRRPKKTHSEIALRDVKSPVILSYVQSIQRSCLMDTTQRQCPIIGCKMLSYGIINYNDHINLCHFTDRTYFCLYCHEGFTKEYDKAVHENEHIGITKWNENVTSTPSTTRFSTKIASNTQTDPEISRVDVPEDKLKKIVSFFDKITDRNQIIGEVKKDRYNESKVQNIRAKLRTNSESEITKSVSSSDSSDSNKKKSNSTNLQVGGNVTSTLNSEVTSKHPCLSPVRCQLCGENFDYRCQLSLHVDLEHRMRDKFSKFHSCAGIVNRGRDERLNTHSATQNLNRSIASTDFSDISRRKSSESLSYDPSTNIVYYTSMESVNEKPSVVGSLVQNARSGFCYKWEPGTKIIRV